MWAIHLYKFNSITLTIFNFFIISGILSLHLLRTSQSKLKVVLIDKFAS